MAQGLIRQAESGPAFLTKMIKEERCSGFNACGKAQQHNDIAQNECMRRMNALHSTPTFPGVAHRRSILPPVGATCKCCLQVRHRLSLRLLAEEPLSLQQRHQLVPASLPCPPCHWRTEHPFSQRILDIRSWTGSCHHPPGKSQRAHMCSPRVTRHFRDRLHSITGRSL